jgi:hypothetical protein
MPERIRFLDHQGKRILAVDFSNCPAQKVEEIARTVPTDYATAQPLNSVLVLTDFTGAVFNQDALMKPLSSISHLLRNQHCWEHKAPQGFLRGNNELLTTGFTYFYCARGSVGLASGRFGGH